LSSRWITYGCAISGHHDIFNRHTPATSSWVDIWNGKCPLVSSQVSNIC
jgi:hypothetical protein